MNLFLITCRVPLSLARDYLLHTKDMIRIDLEKNYWDMQSVSPGAEIIPSRVLSLLGIQSGELLKGVPLHLQEKLCSMHTSSYNKETHYILNSVVLNTSMEELHKILVGNLMPGVTHWSVLAVSDIASHLAGDMLSTDCSLATPNGIITIKDNKEAIDLAKMEYVIRLNFRKRKYSVYAVMKAD
jgi:hypothetical protein